MKYFLITVLLMGVFIWFFNEYLGWGFAGFMIGAGVGCGLVIGYLDDKIKDLKKQLNESIGRQ